MSIYQAGVTSCYLPKIQEFWVDRVGSGRAVAPPDSLDVHFHLRSGHVSVLHDLHKNRSIQANTDVSY